MLPTSLLALDLYAFDHPLLPGVLPPQLTHLSLWQFGQPLQVGSLPSSLLSFDLGEAFQHRLVPGVLPSSLRVFWHSRSSPHLLARGVLLEGLQVLHWSLLKSAGDVECGVLPDSLQVLQLIVRQERGITLGAIPSGLKWLSLPSALAEREEEMQLPRDVMSSSLKAAVWV